MTNEPSILINGVMISSLNPPYIIAEISANHNQKIETAFQLIKEAKVAGAHAVKIQTFTPDTITLNSCSDDFMISGGLWDGLNLYELYEKAHMPWDWHKPIFDFANEKGITIFSSVFDETSVDFLEELNAPAYKIASFEAIDLPLIRCAAKTGKPLIISTGIADYDEIAESLDAAKSAGATEIALLHCVSGYPAPAKDYNLLTISDMAQKFGVVVGLSDHTLNNVTAITSVATGAKIIEKHFTLDRNSGSPDDDFSIHPDELATLCRDTYQAWSAVGKISYEVKESERANKKFRRSLYFVNDLKAGSVIDEGSIRSVRPGYGLDPKFFDQVSGATLKKDVSRNTPVTWDVLKENKNA